MRPLVVVGDTLLDRDVEGVVERLCPDAPVPVVDQQTSTPRPGGAGLAATLLRADGRDRVILVTALGEDWAGAVVRRLLEDAGVEVIALAPAGPTPEKVRIRAAGRTLLRVDRGPAGQGRGTGSTAPPGEAALTAIRDAAGVLVADYGNGVAAEPAVRAALGTAVRGRPVVWDPHPRGAVPVSGSRLVTPNRREAEGLAGGTGDDLAADIARASVLRRRWEASGVAITRGAGGAVMVDTGETPLCVPAPRRAGTAADPCGAGDRFAATAAAVLADGGLLSEATVAGVHVASEFVREGGATSVCRATTAGVTAQARDTGLSDARELARRTRERGGTVVATGGCFDLLHAGHVRTLEAARGLGDCLIVLLNSDDSVSARKGPRRPVVPAADRAAILGGLRCVDAVEVFDEATPEAVLRELRPHIWAKGADYTIAELPEAAAVASWGGETVVLPYLEGRSTTELLREAFPDG